MGAAEKIGGAVHAAAVDDARGPVEHRKAVASDQIRGNAGGGQAAQLFRADRDPVILIDLLQAGEIAFTAAVVTGAQADEAGTDQAAWFAG